MGRLWEAELGVPGVGKSIYWSPNLFRASGSHLGLFSLWPTSYAHLRTYENAAQHKAENVLKTL